MKILAIIPARQGSKRLPGKNTKLLGGLPLIAWSIRTALESSVCADVLVSTDDAATAEVARNHGASVPWLRPSELATDTASSVDVALHALNTYETTNGEVEGLMLLQPTSPFRSADSIRQAVKMFSISCGTRPVVSVSPASNHPAWCFRLLATGMEPFMGWEEIGKRSQDLEVAWMLNGSIYISSPDRLRADHTFLTPDTQPLRMESPDEALDIDTMTDFELCELALNNRSGVTV